MKNLQLLFLSALAILLINCATETNKTALKTDCEASTQRLNDVARQLEDAIEDWRRFVAADKATKTELTPLPSTDEVKFYFLTNKGVYVGQEQMKNFENNSSTWLKLFEEGNNVLTELRKTSEK